MLSNRSKQEVYGGAGADLACVPPTLRGGCLTPANPAKGYAGGRLPCIKVLGAFVGERGACAQRLVARVEEHLEPLVHAARLRDTRRHAHRAQEVHERGVGAVAHDLELHLHRDVVAATREAAAVHDAAIASVWHAVVGTAQATPAERRRARPGRASSCRTP